MDVRIVNPLDLPNWDESILSFPDYSFFHTSAWTRVLVDTYGYKPVYATAQEGKDFSAVVPMMEVNSFLTGRRGVGLPFTDHCEPLIRDASGFGHLFEALADYGKKNHWSYIEFRGGPLWVSALTGGRTPVPDPGSTALNAFSPGKEKSSPGPSFCLLEVDLCINSGRPIKIFRN